MTDRHQDPSKHVRLTPERQSALFEWLAWSREHKPREEGGPHPIPHREVMTAYETRRFGVTIKDVARMWFDGMRPEERAS